MQHVSRLRSCHRSSPTSTATVPLRLWSFSPTSFPFLLPCRLFQHFHGLASPIRLLSLTYTPRPLNSPTSPITSHTLSFSTGEYGDPSHTYKTTTHNTRPQLHRQTQVLRHPHYPNRDRQHQVPNKKHQFPRACGRARPWSQVKIHTSHTNHYHNNTFLFFSFPSSSRSLGVTG
jgi:hypothetical protein